MSTQEPSDVDRDIVHEVGAIAIQSSQMEFVAGIVYERLLGSSKAAQAIAHGQNWATVVASCNAILVTLQPADLAADMTAVFKSADAAYRRRSEVVHGYWVGVPGSPAAVRHSISIRRFKERAVHRWTLTDLQVIRADLRRAADELWRLSELHKSQQVPETTEA